MANNIKEFLDKDMKKDMLRLLTAGSVDDGKSTLIGRLLVDSKKLYEDQLETLERDSHRMGRAEGQMDYSLLLDGLKAEREQGITIDVAYRYFSTSSRKFIIADTPGHEQYTRNMITGGSTANVAIILVDAQNGITEQTKRHTFLVSLMKIRHVLLAVNKMDLVGYSKTRFLELVNQWEQFTLQLGIDDVQSIPLSARNGDNVVEKSLNTSWYKGQTLLEYLETVPIEKDYNLEDVRFAVQYVLHPRDSYRSFAGKVSSGIIRKGMDVEILPSRKTSKIKKIITYDKELDYAFAPQSISIVLEDELDVSRGDMIVSPNNLPIVGRKIRAMLVWMDEEIMDLSKAFYIKQTTNLCRAFLSPNTKPMSLNQIAEVTLTSANELFYDPYEKNKALGSFILIDPISFNTSAVGIILEQKKDNQEKEDSSCLTLDFNKLRIEPKDFDIVERIVKDLSKQGIYIKIIKK